MYMHTPIHTAKISRVWCVDRRVRSRYVSLVFAVSMTFGIFVVAGTTSVQVELVWKRGSEIGIAKYARYIN